MDNQLSFINNRSKIAPQKFALYVSFVSLVMLFAALTSAYVVRQAGGNWLEFALPSTFFYSTGVLVASSVTIQLSYYYFKNGNPFLYRSLLSVSFILGLVFLMLQYQGWLQLERIGVILTGNPAGSFVYVISGLHAAHILGGLAAISVAMLHAFLLPYKVNRVRLLRFELTIQYWHFVDILWIYLLIFLILQR